MDNIMRRIENIIDYERFDGDGTLGEQVAQRLLPIIDEAYRAGYETATRLRIGNSGRSIFVPPVTAGAPTFAQALAELNAKDKERPRGRPGNPEQEPAPWIP